MGNYSSCLCLKSARGDQTSRILDKDGRELRRVNLPMTVAELMLEEPGCVVSNLAKLRKTRRVSAMRADEEIMCGETYVMVPSGRVQTKISEPELGKIEMACKSGSSSRPKQKLTSSKVLPVAMVEDNNDGVEIKANHKRWNPNLDPIYED